MTEPYDATVAGHYAAYRPPLHQIILARAFSDVKRFAAGLDVGCGTGRSSFALAEYCDHVDAIDPSQSMIDSATAHASITYRRGSAEEIPMADQSVDVVTLAGSLFYADIDAAARELGRVCRDHALVIPYDFNVLIGEPMRRFGIPEDVGDVAYDHTANLSGVATFTELTAAHDRIEFEITAIDLAHVLLADQSRHKFFVDRYATMTPLAALADELRQDGLDRLQADIYFSVYRPEVSG